MKAIRVAGDERGALALELTPEAERYAEETRREAKEWARERLAEIRGREVRQDVRHARFLALVARLRGGAR